MLTYYFYKNIKKNLFKSNKYLYLFSLVTEIYYLILNIITLSKFFFNINNFCYLKCLKKKYNYNFFFYKISFISNFLKKYLNFNKKIKSWKSLIFFFYVTLNSFVSKSSFFKFNFNINLNEFNLHNYSFCKNVILFKINKYPTRFILYYFNINIYKIFLSNKLSLFLLKNIIYIDYSFIYMLKLVKFKGFLNYKFRYLLHL